MTTTNFQNFNKEELFTEQDKKNIRKVIKSVFKAQSDSQRMGYDRRVDLERGVTFEDYDLLAESLFALYEGLFCDNLAEDVMEMLYIHNYLLEINIILNLSKKIKNNLENTAISEDAQEVEQQVKDIKITELESKLLHEIMSSESDGLGMGYSAFDGLDITNEEKGVLSSLIKKGLVYDSTCGEEIIDDDDYRMYCTNPDQLLKVVGLDLSGYDLSVLSFN